MIEGIEMVFKKPTITHVSELDFATIGGRTLKLV
jgi:hypothetical protein